jgi:3-hydroxyacyl-CoA dehydrogenase
MPGRGYAADPEPADELSLSIVVSGGAKTLWENDQAALIDLGDGVPVFEFRSKANTLGTGVMTGLRECLELVESGPHRGLVIGNDAEHFSPGANLVEMMGAVQRGTLDEVDTMIARFQDTIQRVCYATKPVVMATRGRVLGGACEMLMACGHAVAAAESYVGLVELGAGLIPAGGGTMRMAALAAERAPGESPEQVMPWLSAAFETLARVTVAGSAHHAQRLGFLGQGACIVRNADRRLFVAKEEVLRLSREGYLAPPERLAVYVLGEPARQQIEAALRAQREAGHIDAYGELLAGRLAWVITGGDLDAPAHVTESYLLDLEREVFVGLLGEEGTQQRIQALVGPARARAK